MPVLDVVLPTALLALLLWALHRAPAWAAPPPLRRGVLSTYRLAPRRHWVIERTGFTVSASTTALNAVPKRLIARLEATIGAPTARDRVRQFYDAGVAFGVLGAAGALVGALWAWARAWLAVWHEAEAHARTTQSTVAHVVKRAFEAGAKAVPKVHGSSGGIQPLIPGITAPLSHLPTLILAFLLAQLVHELGHALAGALEDIAPSKLAFSLHAVLPSASIVFPSNVEFYPVRARARIATSGPWHNLLMWLTLISLVPFGHGIFYTNRAHDGRIVVNPGDRFTNHLRRGDLITHVDDFFIGGRDDVWTQYLSGTDTDDEEKGWCLSKWEFGDARLAPCTSDTMVGFQEVGAVGDGALARCLEPHSIIAQPITNCRCPVSQVCIRPAASEHLVRVRYKRGGEKTDTLLWAGDRSALLEVEVSMRSPRIWSSGTRWFEIFMSYLKMATLSLYLINLLTLPHTDGIQLFSALLSVRRLRGGLGGSSSGNSGGGRLLSGARSQHPTINPYRYDGYASDDSEGGEPSWAGGHRREEIWQRRLRRAVEGGTAALVVGWVFGWLMLALLRSS